MRDQIGERLGEMGDVDPYLGGSEVPARHKQTIQDEPDRAVKNGRRRLAACFAEPIFVVRLLIAIGEFELVQGQKTSRIGSAVF